MNGPRVTVILLASVALTGLIAIKTMDGNENPVTLSATRTGSHVTISLVGSASAPIDVVYKLSVEGASTVRQGGRVRLSSEGREVLARVTIDGARAWHARSQVVADGVVFDQTIDSANIDLRNGMGEDAGS